MTNQGRYPNFWSKNDGKNFYKGWPKNVRPKNTFNTIGKRLQNSNLSVDRDHVDRKLQTENDLYLQISTEKRFKWQFFIQNFTRASKTNDFSREWAKRSGKRFGERSGALIEILLSKNPRRDLYVKKQVNERFFTRVSKTIGQTIWRTIGRS